MKRCLALLLLAALPSSAQTVITAWAIPYTAARSIPVRAKNPEGQMWFDQGNALLHSFWDYEAERMNTAALQK